jgi:riboflavin biosynthesis pyrimidine reductase
MALIASLVMASNGATTLGGSSSPLSTPADRKRFLSTHRAAKAIIIGKRSALSESYGASDVPIYIFTPLQLPHPQMKQVVVSRDLAQHVREIAVNLEGDLVVEAGPTLLMALVESGVIEILQLSLVEIEGDGDFIDLAQLLSHFTVVSDVEVDHTRLLECRYKSDSANS